MSDLLVETPLGNIFARTWGGGGGRGAPIILFHDSLGCVELWRDFPEQLCTRTGRVVVAYDRLGFGRSDPHPGTLGPGFIRDEARTALPALRAALGIDHMVLYGHSVGGAMAVCAAGAWPEATEAIVTEAAQAFVEERTLAGVRAARTAMRAPDHIRRLARYHGQKAHWVLDAWTETWLSPAFRDWRLDDDLRAVRCPVLALHGDRDEYGSLAFPERIGALPPVATRVVILEDCGHIPHREQPGRVLEVTARFLQGASRSRPPLP